MARRLYRKHLGPHFSEGARKLWAALIELGRGREDWNFATAAAELSEPANGIAFTRLQVFSIIYGHRPVTVEFADVARRRLKIDPLLWGRPSSEPFTPPDTLAAERRPTRSRPGTGRAVRPAA